MVASTLDTYSSTSDSSKRITRHRLDESTSNLLRHVNTCSPSAPATSPPLPTWHKGRFRYLAAAWSAHRARPHAIIEDEEFREILVMLYPAVEIHSRQTVARDISDMYERSRVAIAHHLQSREHRLHLALDGWASPNVFSFLGVNVLYFDEGELCGFVLDFIK